MAVCPECQKTDKLFFAATCPNCNNRIPFIEQCVVSFIYLSVKTVFVILMLWGFLELTAG